MKKCKGAGHLVTPADVTAGIITFNFQNETTGFGAIAQVRDFVGALKAWGGIVIVGDSGAVTVINNGITDFAVDDTITVIAF